MSEERRKGGIRRDINGLVRGKDGEISGSKLGTYLAQYIAAKMLLGLTTMPSWDVLAILFMVLIAPEFYKQAMAMKWGGGYTQRTERQESTVTRTTTKPDPSPLQGITG